MWRINARKGSELIQVEILDLQAPGGLDASILPKAF